MTHATSKRRGRGEDSIYWDATKSRYVGAVSLGYSPSGTRIRKGLVISDHPADYEREEYQGAGIAGDAHIVRFCISPGGRLGGDVGQPDRRPG